MEIFHCYQEEFNLKSCISAPPNIMTDEQTEVEPHSFFYSSKSSQGDETKDYRDKYMSAAFSVVWKSVVFSFICQQEAKHG